MAGYPWALMDIIVRSPAGHNRTISLEASDAIELSLSGVKNSLAFVIKFTNGIDVIFNVCSLGRGGGN